MHRRPQALLDHVEQVGVERVEEVGDAGLGAHPALQLGVLADVGRDEAGRGDQDQVLGALLVLHELGPRDAHDLDPGRALPVVVDVGRRVRPRPREPHPGPVGGRLGEQAVAQVVGQVGQDGELAPDDPVGLGVAEALGRTWRPVLAGELGQLVDDGLDQLLLVRELALLGQLQPFVGSAGVAQPLGQGEQARAEPAVELWSIEELGPPLQPPQPQNHVVQGP